MATLPPDPLEPGGIREFGERLRKGDVTAASVTGAYLARIAIIDKRLGAFEHVAGESAMAAAHAIDRLLAAGTDLGPLMGVPIAIKDNITVKGMPTTVGSNLDLTDLVGPEARFVGMLKRAGCVILGKTKLAELSFGRGGVNPQRGTPWNPWDSKVHRIPEGSSSGSAAATAAGLCAFAIGTDTGGSIRAPAAHCGLYGLRPTIGLWPTDGVFAVSPTLDTVGPLTTSAADAAIVFAALTGKPMPKARPPRGLRLGKPVAHFFDDLDPLVEKSTAAALATLRDAGVDIVEIDVPEAAEASGVVMATAGESASPSATFAPLVPAELLAGLGRERFLAMRGALGLDVGERTAVGLDVTADTYVRLLRRHRELCRLTRERMQGFDGWVTPTVPVVAPPVADVADLEGGRWYAKIMARNTKPVGLLGLCASSTPIPRVGSPLPVGLQLLCPGDQDAEALSIALTFEKLFGLPPRPDLTGFV
ncbi:MAG: amidase [Alphaproteobacteria bacterium]|nr:amidase [Alphaproteobacteria bacterium]